MTRTGQHDDLLEPSPLLLGLFTLYAERYLQRHFHGVRLARSGSPPAVGDEPTIVYMNHPSWWDPLVGLLLARRLFPEHRHFAPIDATALRRYRFFERLGFFGVEQGSARGARRFLSVARARLDESGTMLWLTPEGRFSDPRARPLELASGLAHLVRRLESGRVVPLALEYPFWEERTPEALARFGEPRDIAQIRGSNETVGRALSDDLARCLDHLGREAQRREPADFELLVGGRAGVGGVYDLWRRTRATLGGRRFEREHGALVRASRARAASTGGGS